MLSLLESSTLPDMENEEKLELDDLVKVKSLPAESQHGIHPNLILCNVTTNMYPIQT